jgi:peroxiredoxin
MLESERNPSCDVRRDGATAAAKGKAMALEDVWMLAPDLPVLAAKDAPTQLSDYWNEGPTIFYFLRHFGCPLCQVHLAELQASITEFTRRGMQVVAVGQGTGDEADKFCTQWGIGLPCLGDPERSTYQEYGLRRGGWWSVLFRSLLTRPIHTLRLLLDADLEGVRLTSTDLLQLPGVAIVEWGGTLRAIHVATRPEDMPPPSEVCAAIDRLHLGTATSTLYRRAYSTGIAGYR